MADPNEQQCPVCMETVLKAENTRDFPCNHSLCMFCYVEHTARSIKCPFCRRPYIEPKQAKDELIQTILFNLVNIEKKLQKLETTGFLRPLENEREIKTRLDKITHTVANMGLTSYSTRVEDDLTSFLRIIGTFPTPHFATTMEQDFRQQRER